MIKIKDYEIPNRIDELTIEQFQKISDINRDVALHFLEKQIEIFTYLGVPDIWDEVSAKQLKVWMDEFNDVPDREFEFVKAVEIDGYTYRAYDGEDFELSAKDFSLIEKKIKSGGSDIAYIMAVLFKREDLDKKEHYADAHIKQKTKLFSSQPAEICVKYIAQIGLEVQAMAEKKIADVEQNNA